MQDFLNDLDAYFCETYANYDKLCILPEYRMPKMQTSEVRADGRTYAYTLPPETMRLALQENKASILKTLKAQLSDKTFSFSFLPLGFFTRIKNVFSRYAPHKWLRAVMEKYNLTEANAGEGLAIEKEIWTGIYKGKYAPTKNLIFSFALANHIPMEDMKNLLAINGYEMDYTQPKDVVIAYLVGTKVFNRPMIDDALAEYKIENLFLA